jgi:hypothetical protein
VILRRVRCVTSRKKERPQQQKTEKNATWALGTKTNKRFPVAVSPPRNAKNRWQKFELTPPKVRYFFEEPARAHFYTPARVSVLLHTHTHKQHKKQSRSLSLSLICSDPSTITMYSSSSSSFSLSFPRALKASRKTKSRCERRITPRSKKMSNRCFVNFAANGNDDDRAMVAAEQIATSKSTIDSSKVDFAMPNRLLSSDLTTVRFSFSPKARI